MKSLTGIIAIIIFGVLVLAALSFSLEKPDNFVLSSQMGQAKHGKLVYERYCTSCHGNQGDGKGEYAEWIYPKPRDFRQGTFKWRSTPSGSLPTDADLERTMVNGLYGTHMPAWYVLNHREHMEVIAYIKTFSDRWTKESPESSLVIPPEPPNDSASVKRGRGLFLTNGCDKCHGDQGQGDGPSSQGLKDDWGYQIVPYNLTVGRIKCGQTAADIYRVLFTGLGGTPMPSFEKAIDKDQAWDIAHYILSLGPSGRRHASK